MTRVQSKSLKGGSYNVLYNRDPDVVKNEVVALLKKHNLDFLCLQEANDYYRAFSGIDGYVYIANPRTWGGKESTILVREGIRRDKKAFKIYGNGWTLPGQPPHPAPGMAQIRLDGWLYIRSLHLPHGSNWQAGRVMLPKGKVNDYIAGMKILRNFFSWPCIKNARIAAGDWNESPETTGEFSPAWLSKRTGATTYAPTSLQGFGKIDWVAAKGGKVTSIFKDTRIDERSDHEPVIFTVVKTTRRLRRTNA